MPKGTGWKRSERPSHYFNIWCWELIAHAIENGATTITVGLGGSGTNDAGAGMLAALGATSDGAMNSGGVVLKQLTKEKIF